MIRLFSAAAKVKSWIALKTWNVFATWILILNLIAVSLKEYIISISLQECCLYLVLEVFYSVVSRMLSLVDSNNIRKYLHLHILIEPFIYGFNLSTKHSNNSVTVINHFIILDIILIVFTWLLFFGNLLLYSSLF